MSILIVKIRDIYNKTYVTNMLSLSEYKENFFGKYPKCTGNIIGYVDQYCNFQDIVSCKSIEVMNDTARSSL